MSNPAEVKIDAGASENPKLYISHDAIPAALKVVQERAKTASVQPPAGSTFFAAAQGTKASVASQEKDPPAVNFRSR